MLKWTTSKEDVETIGKIIDRYMEFHHSLGIPKLYQRPRMDLIMDVEATHCNGCPLKLTELLNAADFDFAHDLIGIQNNLNRSTGELENCFVPRYAS